MRKAVDDLTPRDEKLLTRIHGRAFEEGQGKQHLDRVLEVKAFLRDISTLTQYYRKLSSLIAVMVDRRLATSYPRALDMALQDTEKQWMKIGRIKIGAKEGTGEGESTTLTHQEWNEKEMRWQTASAVRLPTQGGLSAEQLTKHVLSHGKPFKDVGAPLTHGEYAHRIQWYCLYHHFVETKKWTREELMIVWNLLGSQVLINRNCIGELVSLWDSVLDIRGLWAQGKTKLGTEERNPALLEDYRDTRHAVAVNITSDLSWSGTDLRSEKATRGILVSEHTSSLAAAIGVRKTKRSGLVGTGKDAIRVYNEQRQKLGTPEAHKLTATGESNPK
jgi:hypothetical protein